MALDKSISVHNSTHLLSNLPAACCALGYSQKGIYHLGDYCKESIRELIRYLRRDDADHTARRYLGKAKVVVLDLLPMVKHYYEDDELFDLVLRLLVNLTNPVLLLWNEELPSDAADRRCYLQIISQLQVYKEAFADECLWAVFSKKLRKVLDIDPSERTEEVGMVAERILVLTRNILQVPADSAEGRPDNDASVHDQVIWALSRSGLTDLILYISSINSEQGYCMHVLEIVCLMLREQSGAELAESKAGRSLAEQSKDVEELMTARENEKMAKYNKMRASLNTRHSRFGGTFVVTNIKGIGEKDMIVHKPYCDTEKVPHDIKKEKLKVRKNEMALKDDDRQRRSPYGIRLFLQTFCSEFLTGSYNTLMRYVKGCLMRRIAQPNDESFYLWAMKFFMEFNRTARNDIKLVSETMNVSCFYWVITQLENCHGQLKADKKKLLFWSRRTHFALRAYLELMKTLTSMELSTNKATRDSARVIQGNLFYVVEHREALLWLLNSFDETKMSRAYLQDLIETLHVFTKLLEKFCKSQRGIVVQTKRVKRRKNKKSRPAAPKPDQASDGFIERLWDEVAPEVSVVLSSGVIPDDVVPFDATSDSSIDDQKVNAMRRIHTLLKYHQFEEAVGLLRAAREVWPENDIFGRANANPEDELMTLREVFLAEIAQDPEASANIENAQNEEDNGGEEGEEEYDEEDEEEEGVPTYSEKQYDFNEFLKRLVCSQAIKPACLLLETFNTNPKLINHCVAKLLHRIAFDAKAYAVLFQASLFIQFRKIMASPIEAHQELATLAKFVFRKFVKVARKNKMAFVELLPWKSAKQAFAVETGYDDMNKESAASKKAWQEEEEDELRRLHAEYMRDEPDDDMVDWILERLINRHRTKAGVKKKLRELFLILPSGKSKPPKNWSEAEISELAQLYERYKDSNDPLDNILMGLTVKRGKSKVVDKLLELGLVSDRKQLYKKSRSKTNVRRGENNSSSEDSDSDTGAKRQKGKKKQTAEQKDRVALKKAHRKGPATRNHIVSSLIQVVESDMRGGLQWLLESFKEAADDLEAEGSAGSSEGIPLLPVEEDAVAAMDDPLFHRLLQNLGMSPPFDEQEMYWRIPDDLSPAVIREKASLVESALDGTLSKEDEVLLDEDSSDHGSQAAGPSQMRKKKKSQEAQGRRSRLSSPSPEGGLILPSEIRLTIGDNSETESQQANTPQSQQTMRDKKKRPRICDSSSDDELLIPENKPTLEGDDELSSLQAANTSQSRQKSKGRRRLSDAANASQSQQKVRDKKKRPRICDSSSDDDALLISENGPILEGGDESNSQQAANASQSRRKKSTDRRSFSDSSSEDENTLHSTRKSALGDSGEPVTPLMKSTQKSRLGSDSDVGSGSQSVKRKKLDNSNVASASKKRGGKSSSSDFDNKTQGQKTKSKKEIVEEKEKVTKSKVKEKKVKKRINKPLLEPDSENERVSSPVRLDENDINSGNVFTSSKAVFLDSDSDGELRSQTLPKKRKALLSDSDDDVVMKEMKIVVSSDEV